MTSKFLFCAVIAASLAACVKTEKPASTAAPTYQAEAKVGDITIEATLQLAHPFLAEYERRIRIQRNGKEVFSGELGSDPGGYAYINLLRDRNFLIIQSFAPHAYRIETNSNLVDKIDYMTVEELEKMEFIGQFEINKEGDFLFSPAAEVKDLRLRMLKGG